MATDLLTSKIPPNNLEAERAILGSLLIEPEAFPRALELLRATDFYKEGHRKIFDAMLAVTDAGQGLDLITTSDALRDVGALEEIGGPPYLAQLVEEATFLTELPSYCRIIAEKARARDLIRIGTELVGNAYDAGDSTEIITTGLAHLEQLQRRAAPVADFPAMLGADLLRLPIDAPTFHVAGWIPRNAVSLIFGDSEAYKSWFAGLIAISVAAGKPLFDRFPVVQAPTLVISEENGLAEDKRRFGAIAAGMGLGNLEGIPIHLASETGFSFDDPAGYVAMRAYVRKHGIQLVVLDSFVRMHRRKENDAGEMNALYMDRIKPLILDGVSLILLHHRRKAQTGPGQTAPAGDSDEIRGSGDIRAAVHSALALRVVSDTQVLVKHNKTRGFKRQEPFVFAVRDTENGATVLTWEGKPEQALDKGGACREATLLLAAHKGSFNRKDLDTASRASSPGASSTLSSKPWPRRTPRSGWIGAAPGRRLGIPMSRSSMPRRTSMTPTRTSRLEAEMNRARIVRSQAQRERGA